ncbi:MAG: hypothetical protein JNL28_12945 [Planctomycetes bacterium]|nr:hypothetical protein [Planctomycetota bacterium]
MRTQAVEGRGFVTRAWDAFAHALLALCTRSVETDAATELTTRRERLFGLFLWRESTWRHGVLHGVEVRHSLFGDMRARIDWRDGVVHGLWREWHKSGAKALECAFESGVPHGKISAWRRDGSKRFVGTYRAGAKTGEWFYLTRRGDLDRKRTGLYLDGLRLSGIKGFNEWLGSP